jgi:hypothetical protein
MEALLAAAVRAQGHDVETRNAPELDARRLQAGLTALVLRTLFALQFDGGARRTTGAAGPPVVDWLVGALERVPAWARDAGASSELLTDPSMPFTKASAIVKWVRPDVAGLLLDAVTDGDARDGLERARDAGVVYEELLELEVRRLDANSLCVRPRRTWVSAGALLAEPPKERAKWLMAHASLPKSAVQRFGQALAAARSEDDVLTALERLRTPKTRIAPASSLVVQPAIARRRSGSHFTPKELCRAVVERSLGPLVATAKGSDALLALRICDPSMGSGAFLEVCAELLSHRLVVAWRNEGRVDGGDARALALGEVVTKCLYGVDKDPIAVDLARCALARLATMTGRRSPDLSSRLRCGDALVGTRTPDDDRRLSLLFATLGRAGDSRFDWNRAFPEVFDVHEPGFDACIGNPPWVAYAGRAAQPLDPALSAFYLGTNPAFGSYRSLHGLFVRRAAELLRPGGRLGFVLPTSVADLDGYRPTRRAHDAIANVDENLDDFGDGAFDGVFQPCMALTSTRRATTIESPPDAPWPLARKDLDDVGARILARLSSYPTLDPELFGERGFQTTGRDLSHIRRLPCPEPPFVEPIREGIDVREFQLGPPRCYLDPVGLTGRFRQKSDWNDVAVLIRQTARFPIAAVSDGVAFRNSILAGFGNDEWTPPALAAYLNSNALRYFHFVRHRDARQGMPQLKIGHLRAMPAIRDAGARAALDLLGRRLVGRNTGIEPEDRAALDGLVFDALDFRPDERALVTKWADENPLPKRRQGKSRRSDPLW